MAIARLSGMTTTTMSRLRFAELSSAVGAGVLGFGLGALLATAVRGLAIPILLSGLLLHAWGMTDKHRLENERSELRPFWFTAVYWACWSGIAALLITLVLRVA
jgi:hypothetical protein